MASITKGAIHAFILDMFLGQPHLMPPPIKRFEHAGSVNAHWGRINGKAPALSRIDKALRDLTTEGLLEEAMDPDFNRFHGYKLAGEHLP